MKQRLLLFMFAAVAALTAWADEYIKVSNRDLPFDESWSYPSSHFNDTYRGTVSWDASTRTLTLNDFGLDRWNYGSTSLLTCLEINSKKDVNIKLEKGSYLRVWKGQTLVLHGNTTFIGDGDITIVNEDSQKPGIEMAEDNLTVTINGPDIKFLGSRGIRGRDNTGTLYMKGGTLEGEDGYKAVIDMARVQFDYGMGVRQPHGIAFDFNKHTFVYYENGKDVATDKLILGSIWYYGFRITGIDITANNYDCINYWNNVQGTVYYYPEDHKLMLVNATIHNQTPYSTIYNYDNNSLKIELTGENKFTYYGSRQYGALDLRCSTSITGIGETSSLEAEPDDAGIYVADDKWLNLSVGTIKVPYIVGGGPNAKLSMHNKVKVIAAGNSNGTIRNIKVPNYSSKPNIAVLSTKAVPRFIWNKDSKPGVYKDRSSYATGAVTLCTTNDVTWYPMIFCGQKVNSLNSTNPQNEYVERGSISYDNTNRCFWLNDATIDYPVEESQALRWDPDNDDGLTIELKGNNTIKCENSPSITTNKSLTIAKGTSVTGDVSLAISGSNAKVFVANDLTLFEVASATIPEFETYNTLKIHDSKLTVSRKQKMKNCEMSLSRVVSKPASPAYYDDEEKKLVVVNDANGPVEIVRSSDVDVYPITFCGTEINSANASCVMNKYILGGSLSVVKSSSAYDIDMKDLSVVYKGSLPVFYTSTYDRMDFNVQNTNLFNLTEATTNALFLAGYSKNIYIHGDTKKSLLGVFGSKTDNAGAISVEANSTLTISNRYAGVSDANFQVSVPRIFGTGSTSVLAVNDYTLQVFGNSRGTVSSIKCQLGSDVELYNTSSTHKVINDLGVYENGYVCTDEVKFVKKGESVIAPTGITLNTNEITLREVGETYPLTATVLPDNATDKSVRWLSSHPDVATVSDDGLVTAKKQGITFVYAYSSNDKMAFCKVIVDFAKGGTLGNQGTWRFENGVLTIDYVGQMPQNCTSKTTDPEIAYRLKWIDLLPSIQEVVITGTDVEVQPYFLFYSGDGDQGQHPDDHIKKITLGSGVKKIGKQAFAIYDLRDLYCYSLEAPVLSSDSGNGNVFWKSRVQANQAFLHLVSGASTDYARTDREWTIFNRAAHALDPEDDPDGIINITEDAERTENSENFGNWFDLSGRTIGGKPGKPGLYIRNGKKVVVK